jgi:hypothetical protein
VDISGGDSGRIFAQGTGWELGRTLTARLPIAALEKAIADGHVFQLLRLGPTKQSGAVWFGDRRRQSYLDRLLYFASWHTGLVDPNPDQSLAEYRSALVSKIDHQIRLLRRVKYWSLLPTYVGLLTLNAGWLQPCRRGAALRERSRPACHLCSNVRRHLVRGVRRAQTQGLARTTVIRCAGK